MPWTGTTFKRHNRALSGAEARKAAAIANAVLRSSGDEGLAIATANKKMKGEAKTSESERAEHRYRKRE